MLRTTEKEKKKKRKEEKEDKPQVPSLSLHDIGKSTFDSGSPVISSGTHLAKSSPTGSPKRRRVSQEPLKRLDYGFGSTEIDFDAALFSPSNRTEKGSKTERKPLSPKRPPHPSRPPIAFSARGRITSEQLHEEREVAADERDETVKRSGNSYIAEGGKELAFVEEALSKLKTGEDAISFFALHGNNTPVKFVHLNRATGGKRFRPYDLTVVDPSDVEEEHFTMSAAGLVRVAPNEPSDFTSSSEWMRLSTIFNVLSSIRFFKNYLVRKMFTAWRSSIRFNLYNNQRKRLAQRLFLAKPTFCEPLLEINKCISEMHHVPLLDLRSQKTYEVSHFSEHQNTKRTEASKELEAIMEKVQSVCERVCNDATKRARITNEAFQSSVNGMSNPHEMKTRSLVALKEERAERIQKLKVAMQEAGMLGDFIRLADYMTVEHLVNVCINTHQDLLNELLKTSRKAGMFETTVGFTNDRLIHFQPNDEDIRNLLQELSSSTIRAVGSVSRILFIRPFKSIVAPIIVDSPDVRNLVVDSKAFCEIRSEMNEKVSRDFVEAMEYAQTFQQVLPIFIYNQTFNFEEYKKQGVTLAKIKKDMTVLSEWSKELERMRVGNTVGILHVESRKLRSSLVPVTEQGLDRMKSLLAQLAREKCGDLLDEYKILLRELEAQPQHLKDFAHHVQYVQQLKMDTKEMMRNTASVEEMYRLCSSYGMKVSAVDMVQFDDLKHYTETFASKRKEAESYIDSKLPEMTQTLDMNIAKLGDQLAIMKQNITSGIFVDPDADAVQVLEDFETVRTKLTQLDELSKTYSQYQELFHISVYDYKNLRDTEQVFAFYHNLWKTIHTWNEKTTTWYHTDFQKLDVEALSMDVQNIYREAAMAHKRLGNKVTERFLESCTDFKQHLPVILELGNPAMKPRHWEQIFKMLDQPWFPSSTFTLDNLTDYEIFAYASQVSEISANASGEAALEASLEKIKDAWSEAKFELLQYRNSKNAFILASLEDIFILLEDNQVTLQTMMGSRFLSGVRKDVEHWQKKLSLLSDTLDEWTNCQRNWMYLETIFCADDIQEQLPDETEKFHMVDRLWKDSLLRVKENPFVIECISKKMLGGATSSLSSNESMEDDISPKLYERFQFCNKLLDEVQKSLEDYLETKRSAFPRFYFLSNDELLEILSQTRDPTAVQDHLSKCFDSMKSLAFESQALPNGEEQHNIIVGMTSAEGEYVPFIEHVNPNGELVEHWLSAVEKVMRKTLQSSSRVALDAYTQVDQIEREEWIFSNPAQCVLAIDQITWTFNTAKALRDNAVKAHFDFSVQQIQALIRRVREPLSKLQRTLMGALIVLDVHGRDVVNQFLQQKIASESNFEWTRQLRYYYDYDVDAIMVRQTNTRFQYAYEYLGNSPRLVITPLTDLCYMTLTGALHLRFGGAPAGPAGTGKTETTKDLAKALAVQCVVFNCSDGLDYKIMGRFFSGLAQCGAWACFDEFNRIDIEVLSVIAQQILTIQQGIINHATRIDFEGKSIPLNHNFGVFITMNPGYAGRTELPDNLKALFRPVAMMVPDYRLIAEIMLFSEGFSNALPLSNKMTQLYKLSSEQLSKQDHYDFGMRAVKSVLVAAGNLKRKEPNTREDLLLIRAMRDSNVPKFLEQDLELFQGIISDLFPDVQVPFIDYGKLQEVIEEEILKENLVPVPRFVRKVIQVHETQLVRHGMMLVGEAGSGKTTNARILAKALTTLKQRGITDGDDGFFKVVKRMILNPKSISAGELYGMFNDMTGEWSDGIVPHIVRSVVKDDGERKWIIFDGPVDAVWIENMNTVLDDNKTLCLANSERIKIPSHVHMMFEVQDLAVASPATVSRCGMVYMEQLHIGQDARVDAWAKRHMLKDLLPSQADRILRMIKQHIPNGISFVRKECKSCIPVSDAHLLENFLNIFIAMLSFQDVSEEHEAIERLVSMMFVFSFTWSIGSNLNAASRERFSLFTIQKLAPLLDGAGKITNIFDCFVDPTSAVFLPWTRAISPFEFSLRTPYFDLLVPTVDTTRYSYLLKILSTNKRNTLFMGETGVGKSVIVSTFLNSVCQDEESTREGGASSSSSSSSQESGPEHQQLQTSPHNSGVAHGQESLRLANLANNTQEFIQARINYSARTKPHNIVEVLETSLEKKRKTLLGPPGGKRMLLFIDDINMPTLETYGAQPPNELVRQVVDQGGFYDTEKLFFKNVMDVNLLAACAPPGGGRSPLPPRLLRHFHTVWMPDLSDTALLSIFQSILSGFLKEEVPKLLDHSENIVKASIELYKSVLREMLPTPSKSHYTFNLRDLSKVFQGILMVKNAACTSEQTFLQLWLHEEARVFRDRLLNETDRKWFDEKAIQVITKHLPGFAGEEDSLQSDIENLVFGDFKSTEEHPNKPYELVASSEGQLDGLGAVFADFLEEYNITYPSQMHLVFFRDAIRHVARICRILRQPRGNALLVGVGGSGRQSLTRLGTFVSGFRCVSIEMTRGYGPAEFHENLRSILIKAGTGSEPLTFLFSDTQIADESFLEDLNNLLNSGQIPNLFQPEDYERILTEIRPLAKERNKVETRENLLNFFTERVRENLHIVLAFSPIGSAFRTRCRMFPSLVNCCTIDWFDPWPRDALYSVAKFFLIQNDKNLGIEAYVEPLCQMCVHIHKSVEDVSKEYLEKEGRYNYTTPTSYLELIRTYKIMLAEQREKVTGRLSRYQNGLQKLLETEQVVAGLQETLTDLVPTLEKAQQDTSALLERLAVDQKEADAAREVALKDEAIAKQVAAEVNTIKNECQADLDEAMPAYESAVKALDLLDKKSIQEVKSFAQPPPLVAFTLEAVCILLGVKPDWPTAKKVLNDINFLQRLKEFDKDNIDPKKIRKLAKYVNEPDFNAEKMKSVSTAACSLCMWVHAVVIYDSVVKNIAPKKAKLGEAEANLAQVERELAQKQSNLQAIVAELESLQAQYEESLQNKKDIEARAQQTEVHLRRATQLIDGLGDEKDRWTSLQEQLKKDLTNLVGNMMLATGSIAYLGPFTAEYRQQLTAEWGTLCKKKKIPVEVGGNHSLVHVLADPVVVRQWHIDGLPADSFSTENGVLATLGRRWPLMIDPQGQANKWIRNMFQGESSGGKSGEKPKGSLNIIKLSDPDFLRTLENSIRFGNPVLLENVGETLDATLEPILLKQVFKKGGQQLLRLGDSDVPYSDEFKLFITTKLPNPHYLPEVMVKITVVNFTVTLSGLEDQLLVDAVRCERPDLELRKDELVVSIASDKKALKDIEDKILQMLANSSGNILDDEELIQELGKSKKTSHAISTRMVETETTTAEIDAAREVYRPVARRGSILYFVIASLPNIDPMYQYSLQYFQNLFVQLIKSSPEAEDVSERVQILLSNITEKTFVNICRGLFEKHKLIFSVKIAVEILRASGAISEQEWKHFLLAKGPDRPVQEILEEYGEKPSFLTDRKAWIEVCILAATFPVFSSLVREAQSKQGEEWKMWMERDDLFKAKMPGGWDSKLTLFQKLLLVKSFRKEQVVFSARDFVGASLGTQYMNSPPFDLQGAYADSNCATPIIFILSPGAEVTDSLLEIAQACGKSGSKTKLVSLGQGQGPIAEKLISEGRETGNWVCLQNCHLAVSWLSTLEQLLEGADKLAAAGSIHPEHRLWLTSDPSPKFPVSILQSGIKITNEPPRGVRANMARSFADLSPEDFEQGSETWRKLLFGLMFYNALILERRKFGPIGWNIQYGWMNSDQKTAMKNVKLFLDEAESEGDVVPFQTLLVMVGDVVYGGRITDKMDKRTNQSILMQFFNQEILSDGYQLVPGSDLYSVPCVSRLDQVRDLVDKLPTSDKPEIFGLHPNADITFKESETKTMLSSLIASQVQLSMPEESENNEESGQEVDANDQGENSGASESVAMSDDETVQKIATQLLERLDSLPALELGTAHARTFEKVDGRVNAMGVFLMQELESFRTLRRALSSSLRELNLATQGLVVMSAQLEEMYDRLLLQRVPAQWQHYPCLKPLASWVNDFVERVLFCNSWLQDGPPPSYWLSSFFFPQGFCTAVLQTYVRNSKVPIDELELDCALSSTYLSSVHEIRMVQPAEKGVYIHGLFLEGARFDADRSMLLQEARPGVLYDALPLVNLFASKKGDGSEEEMDKFFSCPIYKTSLRYGTLSTTGHSTNYVMSLRIPTDTDPNHWIRRGVALLCMLDE